MLRGIVIALSLMIVVPAALGCGEEDTDTHCTEGATRCEGTDKIATCDGHDFIAAPCPTGQTCQVHDGGAMCM